MNKTRLLSPESENELSHELSIDLTFSILRNYEISRKPLKWSKLKASTRVATPKESFDNYAENLKTKEKTAIEYSLVKPITKFHEFAQYILSKIVWGKTFLFPIQPRPSGVYIFCKL